MFHAKPWNIPQEKLINSSAYAKLRFKDILDIIDWMNIDSKQLFYGVDGVLKEANYIDNI